MISSRQLAAIMFTDIVGFSALMGSDEQKTLEVLEKNRQIHKPIIEEYHGRWIKELGDGVMATFNTVSDAVHAAMKIMESCVAANEYQLSIGIHSAEVVFENNDVFGDGINIASRIETLGIPGSILLSKNVRDQLINKTEFQLASLGSFELKNISEPMEIFALANPGFVVPRREEILGKLEKVEKKSGILKSVAAAMLIFVSAFAIWFFNKNDKMEMPVFENSIAVLPFVNMSDDKEQEYFSDGISEEIINALAQVSELKVIGRTSSFSFKGQNQDLKIIGDQLNVSHILEGSVRKSGNTLRITAQLIKVSDGFHLYSKTFDRELKDVFAIQDEISGAVLDAVKIKMLKKEKAEFFKKYTDNVEAYQHYLRGLYYYNRLDFEKAIESYQAAIENDAEYAIAYAQMGTCFWDLTFLGIDPQKNLPKAIAAIDKASQLDETNAECLIARGRIQFWYEWNFKKAYNSLEKGIQASPNNLEGLRQLGALNMYLGHYAKGHELLDKAERLDPVSILGLTYIGFYYMWEGNSKKILEYAKKVLALEPEAGAGHTLAGVAFIDSEQFDDAVAELELAIDLYPDMPAFSLLGIAYAKNKEKLKSIKTIEEITKLAAGQNIGNAYKGDIYAALGEWDKAVKHYRHAVSIHEGQMLFSSSYLRQWYPEKLNDPRIIEVLEKMELPIK